MCNLKVSVRVTLIKICDKISQFKLNFCQLKQNDFQFNLTGEKLGF